MKKEKNLKELKEEIEEKIEDIMMIILVELMAPFLVATLWFIMNVEINILL